MKSLLFIVILILTTAVFGLGQEQAKQVETLYKLGVASRSKAGSSTDVDKNIGYLETAIKHFTEALKIEPRNIRIILARAGTHKMIFEYEKALADCERALGFVLENKNPDKVELAQIFKTKGEIYEYDSDYKNAIVNYQIALQYNPNDTGSKSGISRSRLLADKDVSDEETEQAMNSLFGQLQRLPKPKNVKPEIENFLDPKPDKFYRLGLANLKKAINAKSKNPRDYFHKLAYKNFSRSIEINPTFAESYFQRSKTYDHDDENRLTDLNRALELRPDFADAYLERANVWEYDDYENRLSDITKAIELSPANPRILLQRADVYLEIYEFEKALGDGEKALQKTPLGTRPSQRDTAEIYGLFGRIYKEGFYYSKALEAYTTAIKFDPANGDYYENRGTVYELLGEKNKAATDFAKAEKLSKLNNPLGLEEFSRTIEIEEYPLSDEDKISPEFNVLFEKNLCLNERTEGFLEYAWGKNRKFLDRDVKLATFKLQLYNRLVKFNSNTDLSFWERGNHYFVMIAMIGENAVDSAIADFTEAIKLNPRSEYFNNRGVAHTEKGDYESAIKDFSESIRIKNKCSDVLSNRAAAYRKLGKITEAEADEKQAQILKQ